MYTPKNLTGIASAPVIIFFHGGGFFFGSICKSYDLFNEFMLTYFILDSHDTMNYHMSMYTGAKVIAVK